MQLDGLLLCVLVPVQIKSGTPLLATGDPLPGVNVTVKGQTRGTTTDGAGQFTPGVNSGEVLVFPFIGYRNREVTATNQTTLLVKLDESSATLQEVIVIGSRGRPQSDLPLHR